VAPPPVRKRLLVEGRTDQYAIAGLMRHFVAWGQTAAEWPVTVTAEGSREQILASGVISTYCKGTGIEALGIVLDANESLESRWQGVRCRCRELFPKFPDTLPADGLVYEEGTPRIGVWIMPDNQSPGVLETFLARLIPDPNCGLWVHVKDSTAKASALGAPFKRKHLDKAHVHTWLAWQDPPGPPLGESLTTKRLDPHAPAAAPFVAWFKRLFHL
jgi:hypothetical protein